MHLLLPARVRLKKIVRGNCHCIEKKQKKNKQTQKCINMIRFGFKKREWIEILGA